MTIEKFSKLAEEFNLIPVYEIITADLLTPVLAYLKIRENGKQSFLLESVDLKSIQKDNYSIIDPHLVDYLANAEVYTSLSFGLPNNRIHSFEVDAERKISGYYTSSLLNTSLGNLYQKAVDRKGVVFQDLTKGSRLSEYSSFIASPIYGSDSTLQGVIFLEISAKAINGIMAEQHSERGFGKTGEVYLAGYDDLLRSSSRFIENSIMLGKCNSEIVQKARRGEVGVKKTIDYRNQQVLSAFGPINIQDLGWVIFAEIDYREAMKEIIILGERILLISFLVFIALTIGVFILSKRITAPLIRLKEVAISVSDGKYEQILPIAYQDEIGLLTQVFNKMVLQIKQITSSLKEREQRLTHFYKATIDGIVLHKTGAPLLVNHALSSLTGFMEDELIKKSPQDYLLIDEETYLLAQQNSIFSFEAILKTKVGRKIPVEVQKNNVLFHTSNNLEFNYKAILFT